MWSGGSYRSLARDAVADVWRTLGTLAPPLAAGSAMAQVATAPLLWAG